MDGSSRQGCILGVDPGSRITGFGLVGYVGTQLHYIASGCIKLQTYGWPERLKVIYENIFFLLEKYHPTMVAIEKIFVYKNAHTVIKLGQARGAALAAVANKNLPIAEYAPRQIKQAIVGMGAATKEQIQRVMQVLLKLPQPPPVDAADALAVAVCHINRSNPVFRA